MPPLGCVFVGLLIFPTLTYIKIAGCLPLSSSDEFVEPLASSGTVSAATLRDITNAFTTVTNDTEKIDYLITNMFNLSLTDPTYVFRLPQDEGANQTVLVMKRSDFMQPIFPNLTRSYIQLMQAKEVIAKDNSDQDESSGQQWEEEDFEGEASTALLLNLQTERSFIEYVEELNRQDEGMTTKNPANDDEWSLLGLHGWTGGLSKPHNADRTILSGTAKHETNNSTEKSTLKWDLPGKMLDDTLGRTVMQFMADSNAEQDFNQVKHSITNMHANHSDADVYISRTNDPFGHSTKWIMKNASYIPQGDERKKRAVVELYSMIKCSSGCDPIVFKGYGCYCGFLGNGQAVDGIDRCCKLHDKCYENTNCISYLEYFVPYLWKCYRGKPLCAIDHGEWGGPSSCAARLCNCDLMLSRCLRQFVCPQKRAICKTSKSRMLQNILFNF